MSTKKNRYLVPIGLLFFFLLCLIPSGQAQLTPVSQVPGTPWQLGGTAVFTSASPATGAFTVKGITYWRILWVPSGTVTGCTLSFDSSTGGGSFSTGGIIPAATIGSCASAGQYITPSATTPTNQGQLTPTITGSGSVTVVIFGYTDNPAAGGTTSSNVNILNASLPVTQSGGWTVGSQPVGFSSWFSNQQAVTTSAAALPSNAAHTICVQNLPTSTQTIYVGPSGVTTSTGTAIVIGQTACGFTLTNTNLMYVIAGSAGSTAAFFGY